MIIDGEIRKIFPEETPSGMQLAHTPATIQQVAAELDDALAAQFPQLGCHPWRVTQGPHSTRSDEGKGRKH